MNPIGHACKSAGRTVKGVANADRIRQIFDQGWEGGAFNFSLETFDDIFMDPDSNEQAGEYIRQKIRALVRDPETAELLCPNILWALSGRLVGTSIMRVSIGQRKVG